MKAHPILVGTAGWSIPSRYAPDFPAEGSHLERYATRLGCVEINSSFYRPHRPETYLRWAASVPDGFRFSVKLPKTITHQSRLVGAEEALDGFLREIEELGAKLGVILAQLPPKLEFDAETVGAFFSLLRGKTAAHVALEPRHTSWFCVEADAVLKSSRIARVAADPARASGGGDPGGWGGLAYFRLHGSPDVYYSDYGPERLEAFGTRIAASAEAGVQTWCIFDNTTKGHALGNALSLAGSLNPTAKEPEEGGNVAEHADRNR